MCDMYGLCVCMWDAASRWYALWNVQHTKDSRKAKSVFRPIYRNLRAFVAVLRKLANYKSETTPVSGEKINKISEGIIYFTSYHSQQFQVHHILSLIRNRKIAMFFQWPPAVQNTIKYVERPALLWIFKNISIPF